MIKCSQSSLLEEARELLKRAKWGNGALHDEIEDFLKRSNPGERK